MMDKINTHGIIIDFGRHQGTPYTQVPVSYLKWMVNIGHRQSAIAQAELDRRGTVTPDLDVSGHAIDRASLYCLSIWQQTRHKNEGIHAWLVRIAQEALQNENQDERGRYLHNGMKFVFEQDGTWPVLKTVIRE